MDNDIQINNQHISPLANRIRYLIDFQIWYLIHDNTNDQLLVMNQIMRPVRLSCELGNLVGNQIDEELIYEEIEE